jgi:hypothetical protein
MLEKLTEWARKKALARKHWAVLNAECTFFAIRFSVPGLPIPADRQDVFIQQRREILNAGEGAITDGIVDLYSQYCLTWKIKNPDNRMVVPVVIHKARTADKNTPDKLRKFSAKWLELMGFTTMESHNLDVGFVESMFRNAGEKG